MDPHRQAVAEEKVCIYRFIESHLMESGFVSNIVAKNVVLDRVNRPLHLYQTNNGHRYAACNIFYEPAVPELERDRSDQ